MHPVEACDNATLLPESRYQDCLLLRKGMNTSSNLAVNAGACEVLLIAFGKEEHVVFTGFQAADLTSALALLEHLTSSE